MESYTEMEAPVKAKYPEFCSNMGGEWVGT